MGVDGSKPEAPSKDTLEPAEKGQWQSNAGACDKCNALDGKYYSPGFEPEKPHPNCKCQVVECYYGLGHTDWREHSRSEASYGMPAPVFIHPLPTVPVLGLKFIG